MHPAGLPGFLLVLLMFLGAYQLFGPYFVFGMAILSVLGFVAALVIGRWRTTHRQDKSLLHLGSGSENGNGKDA
jgi:hypothetical protein